MNVEFVAPTAGINVPKVASKVPPVPEVLDQVPPVCSLVIRFDKVIVAVLVSQTTILPSFPAKGCALIFTVTWLSSLIHGEAPITV